MSKDMLSESKNKTYKIIKKGRTFYSCETCRERKVRCDGLRPICSTCRNFDRTCNYQEIAVNSDVIEEIDLINKKLASINNALKKIEKLSKSVDNPMAHARLSFSSKLNTCLHEFVSINKELNSWNSDSYNSDSNKIIENSIDKKIHVKDKKRYRHKIDSEINLLLSKSALELGSLDIDDDLVIQVIEKISKESHLYLILSKDHIVSRVKDNTLPLHTKLSILAIGSKLFENHVFLNNHLYICGSVYAEKAFEILTSDLSHPCIDKIFSALILVGHYYAVSNLSRTLFLTDLSVKYAYLLKINTMDASKYNKSRSNEDWISLEYKRRVWWYLYIRSVFIGVSYGSTNKISLKDVAVDLPSNDYYYHNYISDTSINVYNVNLPPKINDNEIEKRDKLHLLVKAYIILGIASDFLNSTRIKLTNLPENYHLKKSYIKERIIKFEGSLRYHYSYLHLDQTTSLPKKRSPELLQSRTFLIYFISLYTIKLASIFVNMSDIVPYSLDPEQLKRSKVAKSICIDKAIEIMTLIKLRMNSYKFIIANITVFYAANISGIILTNSKKIADHPKIQVIRESLKYVFILFKKYENCLTILYELDNSVKNTNIILKKSIEANKKFLKLFPELELSQITKKDTNLWFIKPTSSTLAYLCCSVNINSPVYKYIFIQNWFKNEVILTRRSPDEYKMHSPVHKFTCSEDVAFLDLGSHCKPEYNESNEILLFKNSIKTRYSPVNYPNIPYSLPRDQNLNIQYETFSFSGNLITQNIFNSHIEKNQNIEQNKKIKHYKKIKQNQVIKQS
ncbi:hypothetical protein AYI70_g3750 [Smittium culicis]|uniref:Zn(2)-C6 fungal-type domain-containing protein n=1 Tax=Smittium culicis TaxID=133412 RepID=A0A1R1Y219_9FUNG|nr:hypothetical protein AYI70_g3750 [Smittium culicis]